MAVIKQKPGLKSLIYYCVTKYLFFFFILAFINDRFKTLVIDAAAESDHGVFYYFIGYVLYVLFGTIGPAFILLIFMGLLFEIRDVKFFIPAFFAVLVIEYFNYVKLFSSDNFDNINMDGVLNGVISVLFFIGFFTGKILGRSNSSVF